MDFHWLIKQRNIKQLKKQKIQSEPNKTNQTSCILDVTTLLLGSFIICTPVSLLFCTRINIALLNCAILVVPVDLHPFSGILVEGSLSTSSKATLPNQRGNELSFSVKAMANGFQIQALLKTFAFNPHHAWLDDDYEFIDRFQCIIQDMGLRCSKT